MAGRFIVFEGPDGSGKSSQVEQARRHLQAMNVDAVFVRDPGGTQVGDRIRQILLDPVHENMAPAAELLLYAASRAQLVKEIIEPVLTRGAVVIADRFYYSTLAYQGVHGELPEEMVKRIVHCGVDPITPDHVIFFDVPGEVGLSRIGREKDRMEGKGVCFLEEVRQRYLGIFDAMPEEKATILDANRSLLAVTRDTLELLDDLLS